ncbi:hypothetical protein LI177_10385 [bacterium 210820-DFI.6.37]|nr:hypothetical protein [bacterium 210820-DFI.6.37]
MVTLILSMTSIGVYANGKSEQCKTIESIEQELENYIEEQKAETIDAKTSNEEVKIAEIVYEGDSDFLSENADDYEDNDDAIVD